MTTIEIILLVIAIAEVTAAFLAICGFIRAKNTSAVIDGLNKDIRFQRELALNNSKIADEYLRKLEKTRIENSILKQQIDGTAYNELKKVLKLKLKEEEKNVSESIDKYDDGRRDVLNELILLVEIWENGESDN